MFHLFTGNRQQRLILQNGIASGDVSPGRCAKPGCGTYPLVNIQKNYGKSQFLMGKSTILMAIFNSYVSLPEGTWWINNPSQPWFWTKYQLGLVSGAITILKNISQLGLFIPICGKMFQTTNQKYQLGHNVQSYCDQGQWFLNGTESIRMMIDDTVLGSSYRQNEQIFTWT